MSEEKEAAPKKTGFQVVMALAAIPIEKEIKEPKEQCCDERQLLKDNPSPILVKFVAKGSKRMAVKTKVYAGSVDDLEKKLKAEVAKIIDNLRISQ